MRNSGIVKWINGLCGSLAVMLALGCGKSPEPKFSLNMVEFKTRFAIDAEAPADEQAKATASRDAHLKDIHVALVALFGTPDNPTVPAGVDLGLNPARLKIAAGPVWSDKEGQQGGLYRQHCVHCHGITGDAQGPTARFLNPYPRDYRTGSFKFKSTELDAKPTDADLHRILDEGIAGTSMPSFRLLPEPERIALVEYVKYLSIRGEVERMLIGEAAQLSEGEAFPLDPAFLLETVNLVQSSWAEAPTRVISPPPPAAELDIAGSIERGRALFMDEKKGNCKKCHGVLAIGDGTTDDYDEWNKAIVELAKTDPESAELYGLPPRNILPRNLRQGVFRFGRRPLDIYRRVHAGIRGTPMPGASQTLKPEEIWDIVNYVRSLQYDSLSRPRGEVTLVGRERL